MKTVFDFIQPILAMCRSQFPRSCANCGRRFEDFRQYVQATVPVGAPKSLSDGESDDPIGILSYANCPCGSTITLKCEDMAGEAHAMFQSTLRAQSAAESRTTSELLVELRNRIRAEAVKQGA